MSQILEDVIAANPNYAADLGGKDQDTQPSNSNSGASSMPADENNTPDAIDLSPAVDQGPTKPLRLTLRERLHLLAQAVGIKTSLLLILTLWVALALAIGEAARAQFPSASSGSGTDEKQQAKAKE